MKLRKSLRYTLEPEFPLIDFTQFEGGLSDSACVAATSLNSPSMLMEPPSPVVYAPMVSDVSPALNRSTHNTPQVRPIRHSPVSAMSGSMLPSSVSVTTPTFPMKPSSFDSQCKGCDGDSVTSKSDNSRESNKAVVFFVSSTPDCSFPASFFCSRVAHHMSWCGDSTRLFIMGPDEEKCRSFLETPEEVWHESLQQLASCVCEFLGTQQVLGLAATPTAIVLGDFEREAALASAECTVSRAWEELPGVLQGEKQKIAFRYIRFGNSWRTSEEVALGYSSVETRSHVDVDLTVEALRSTRSKSGVVCSMVVSYLVQIFHLLCHIHKLEPRTGSLRDTIESLPPIFFTRHGQSEYNIEDRLGGNPGLTAAGMEDAKAIGEFFEREVKSNSKLFALRTDEWDSSEGFEVWHSQLKRTEQTAAPSAAVLTNSVTRRWSYLNEIHAGVCEDMTNSEVKGQFPTLHDFRKQNKVAFRYPSGESYLDLMIRLKPVLMELETTKKCILVVAHQAVLRTILSYFGGPSVEEAVSSECPHRTVWCCSFDKAGCPRLATIALPLDQKERPQPSNWVGW